MAVEEMKVLPTGSLLGLVRLRKTGTLKRRKKIPIAYSLTSGTTKQIVWAYPAENLPPVAGWNFYSFQIDTKPGSVFVDELESVAAKANSPFDVTIPVGADGVVKWRSDMEFALVERDTSSSASSSPDTTAVGAGLKWSITLHAAKVYAPPDASERDIMGASLSAVKVKDPYPVRSDASSLPVWEAWTVPQEVLCEDEWEDEPEDVVGSLPATPIDGTFPQHENTASAACSPTTPISQASLLAPPLTKQSSTSPSASPLLGERPARFTPMANGYGAKGDDLFSPSSLYSLYSGFGTSSLGSGLGGGLGSGLGSGLGGSGAGSGRSGARYRGYNF
ncbi:hypothetical protein HK097_010930 [Rhizophlyctis rosea]|uniref:Uncharacterized protein n=1 Tax=Rhizophlyctis rosea TaxID=64517 RepID=A0AAD5X2S0_9FUNG|nr:hypothetical protein HK097_010930 [Rhizophlyctis rosea]